MCTVNAAAKSISTAYAVGVGGTLLNDFVGHKEKPRQALTIQPSPPPDTSTPSPGGENVADGWVMGLGGPRRIAPQEDPTKQARSKRK